jgi:3-isopropylmalate dehydrogenase
MSSEVVPRPPAAEAGAADPTTFRLGLLQGDGIGPEIMAVTASVVEAACANAGTGQLEWVPLPVGFEAINKGDPALPAETVTALADCDGWILGPVDFVAYPAADRAGRNPSGELRHVFDLFANIRPARTFSGIASVAPEADLIIARENTEGFYADRNMKLGTGDLRVTDDVALAVGVFTRRAAERITHTACQLALQRRKKVTIVHKANVLPHSMGLFLEAAKNVAAAYDVECDDYHADAMAAHLVRRIADFDVVICENFIGDVFSDLTGELTGSLGLAPSLNVGDDTAMAQAAHGSAPDIAGQNIANPVGEILSAMMLLEWLGARRGDATLGAAAAGIDAAIRGAFEDGVATVDIGGEASTLEFGSEVIDRLRARKVQ